MKAIKILSLLGFCITNIAQLKAQPYFQQEVNYKIDVRLNDVKHELSASETIEYINNSPTELHEIYMHLWPNAYKNNSTALAKQLLEHGSTKFYYASPEQRGFIDSLDFKVNGQAVKWEFDAQNIDICRLILNKPLKPGDKLQISTPFHVKIPEGIFSRLGHLDQAYQITQWYPKPAVYDKYGWHAIPYLNQGEFYSEFGSFDVSITVPKNYVVGTTGDMVDGEKEQAWLNNKVKETEQIKDFPTDMSFPPSDKEFKTLRFKQNRVHDFAWFADKRFHVLKGEIELPHSKGIVTTWIMFTNAEPKLWKDAIPYMNNAVYYYSLWNGDYPYKHATAIDGALTAGAGMEYPNITVIGTSGNAKSLETVIVHEVGHNWFYGILGSNERRYAWMDEGINSFYENRYTLLQEQKRDTIKDKKRGKSKKSANINGIPVPASIGLNRLNARTTPQLEYLLTAARHSDQPLNLPSDEYTEINYGCNIYAKTPACFDYLKAYLGDEAYDNAMQAYFEKWKFKHPYPEDIKAVLEESTGKNLDWFFNGLINSNESLDYKILSSDSVTITLKNLGGVKSPLPVTAFKDGKPVVKRWYEGFNGVKTLDFPKGKYDYYRIDADLNLPELNRQNNTLRSHGLFKRIEPLRFQLAYSLLQPEKTIVNYMPVIGWNNYNKVMVGAAFYNTFVPQKPLEYMIMPMYGTGSNTLAGGADLGFNFISHLFGDKDYNRLGFTAERYAYSNINGLLNFNKLSPSLVHYNIEGTRYKDFGFRLSYLFNENSTYDNSYNANGKLVQKSIYSDLYTTVEDKRAVNPWKIRFDEIGSKDFNKITLNFSYKINYERKTKGVEFSLFAGYSIVKNFIIDEGYFSLSGFNGSQDYMRDGVFLGRSEYRGSLSHQFMENEGGFKTFYERSSLLPYNNPRRNSDYMSTFGIKVPHPTIPVGIFATIGTYKDIENINITKQKYLYEAGAYIDIGGLAQVYLPLPFLLSKDIVSSGPNSSSGPYSNYIRFTFNINRLRPFELVKSIPY